MARSMMMMMIAAIHARAHDRARAQREFCGGARI